MEATCTYSLQVGTSDIEVINHNGEHWVSVRHVCNALGIDFASQRTKLAGKDIFTSGDITTRRTDGNRCEMFCIKAEQAHLWVAGISAAKIPDSDKRKAFIAYQQECCSVLYHHFMGKGEDFAGISQAILQKFNERLELLEEKSKDQIKAIRANTHSIQRLSSIHMDTQLELKRIHPGFGYRLEEGSPFPPSEIDILKEGTDEEKRVFKKRRGELPSRYLRVLKPIT
jgi:hypothetical protein